MNGDTVLLPIHGTVRRHEWQPAKAEPGKAKTKLEPRADSIEARILVLLAVTPEGLTALEVRTALQASKDSNSKLDDVSRDVSDRRIAHIVTGAYSSST